MQWMCVQQLTPGDYSSFCVPLWRCGLHQVRAWPGELDNIALTVAIMGTLGGLLGTNSGHRGRGVGRYHGVKRAGHLGRCC